MAHRQTILLDFDGVLHSYNGWNGGRLNETPLPFARKACWLLAKTYRLVCFTTRATRPEQKLLVEEWLRRHGFPLMPVTATKEPAHLMIDDRALTFTSWSDAFLQQVQTFRTHWNSDESTDQEAALGEALSEDQVPGVE